MDEDKACTSFELFDALLECEVAIIVPHLTSLLTLCLEVTKNTAFDDGTRVKFMTFLSWLVSTKKKALQVSSNTRFGLSFELQKKIGSCT